MKEEDALFWEDFRGQHPAVDDYRIKSDGRYLHGPWENDIHLSFGRHKRGASVRFNLRRRGPGRLDDHAESVFARLGTKEIAFEPGQQKTGQKTYGSFSVVPDRDLSESGQGADLDDWMWRCWQVFEAYRLELG